MNTRGQVKHPQETQNNVGFCDLKHNKTCYLWYSQAFYTCLSYPTCPCGYLLCLTNYNYQGGLFGSPFVDLLILIFACLRTAWKLTFNTVFYNIIFIFGGTALRIAIAIMLSEIIGNIFRKVTQTIIFLPHFVSMVWSVFSHTT